MSSDPANALASAFHDSARDFLSRSNPLRRLRALRDTQPGYERKKWGEMAQAGWFSILLPEALGGLGLGVRELCAVAEEIGCHLLPEPFLAAGVHVAALLRELPDGVRRSTLSTRLCEGNLVAAIAWQEKLGQLEAGLPDTRADMQDDQWVLSGCKRLVVGSSDADGWIVSAATGPSPGLYWLPNGTAGIELTSEFRADGSIMGTVTMNRARIPSDHRLAYGDNAIAALEAANDIARIVQGAELLGVARRALSISLDYARSRVQFGRPIGSFQSLQHRLVDAYIQTELSAVCLVAALAELDRAPAMTASPASRVKARCAHTALLVTRLAIQVHGAMGFTDDCDAGLYFKRALTLNAWLGNVGQHRRRHFRLQRNAQQPSSTTVQHEPSNPPAPTFPRDTDWDAIPEAEFRRTVRQFFVDHFPPHLRNSPYRVRWREIKDWFMTLSRQGWIAPAWPKEFGGMGLPPDKLLAYIEEQEQFGVARAPDQGIIMLGPLLIQHGSKAQQQEFLPPILAGEQIWCQGYSEPNAGSDLASLRTEAILEDDHFVVTGQKIWTTLAHDATHIFMLVRTDKSVKAQAGISFLLADLATPGITVRPIRDITGHEEFCEVFFDRVRVPRANLVGELNQGWTMAKALLGFERIYSGSPKQCQYAFAQLTALAHARRLFDDPAFAMRYAELELDVADAGAAYTHFADMVKSGEPLPANISYLKIVATETYQRIGMLIIEAADEHGASAGASTFGEESEGAISLNVLAPLYNATPATIYGGSSEVQRNILAKSTLHLPS